MRNISILLLASLMALTSCSYNQFGAVATGSSLGGMLGSSIGGLMGGPRGFDKGTLAGMLIGGAVGAVATAPRNQSKTDTPRYDSESYDDGAYGYQNYSDEVEYGSYGTPSGPTPSATVYDLQGLKVRNVSFIDANGNRCLDRGEEATLIMDVYNTGDKTLYNVTPHITCSNRRVRISAPATVESLSPHRGIRYKTVVSASGRLSAEPLTFTVSFGRGSQAVRAKVFTIRTRP